MRNSYIGRWIPTGALKVADKRSDAVAYVWTSPRDFRCVIFFGKQSKPVANYSFRKAEARDRYVADSFAGRRAWIEARAKRQAERKAYRNDYQVGEILVTCWGYEQTNREFFEVVAVKGANVVVREIRQETVSTGDMTGRCVPLPGDYCGEPLTRRARAGSIKIDDVRSASRWSTGKIAGVPIGPAVFFSSYG